MVHDTGVPTVSAHDIEEARELQRASGSVVVSTPLQESRWLSGQADAPVWLKCENLQRTGSFKIRGAIVRMSRLRPEERSHGVVAASAGNHAQGVALAAQYLGIRATVFMPEGAPIPKEKATRAYGAELRFHGHTVDEALTAAQEFTAETGAVLIHPFDHPDIVAGQGTCGLEILEQCPDVRTIVVPLGGGGLLAGVATAIKALQPSARVVGVEPQASDDTARSLRAGERVRVDVQPTIADGQQIAMPGARTWPVIRALVDDVVTVSDEEIVTAMRLLFERIKVVAEPSGSSALAALLAGRVELRGGTVAAVLSGGNVDAARFASLVGS
jgi:threonine dehydratase